MDDPVDVYASGKIVEEDEEEEGGSLLSLFEKHGSNSDLFDEDAKGNFHMKKNADLMKSLGLEDEVSQVVNDPDERDEKDMLQAYFESADVDGDAKLGGVELLTFARMLSADDDSKLGFDIADIPQGTFTFDEILQGMEVDD
eukprot:CAMPEP_0194484764 /NCGR_PEP_ID=MMETSP0253-20130528/6000_1 /TAXON_ID=2966 /ORGANISM="Noctiluca scintillans" /LENGTH=141 /DNA_ID=CAMNT_0039324633 /DNA_START=150 /DNA_END=575 /DNA_ORIENTATION=-